MPGKVKQPLLSQKHVPSDFSAHSVLLEYVLLLSLLIIQSAFVVAPVVEVVEPIGHGVLWPLLQ